MGIQENLNFLAVNCVFWKIVQLTFTICFLPKSHMWRDWHAVAWAEDRCYKAMQLNYRSPATQKKSSNDELAPSPLSFFDEKCVPGLPDLTHILSGTLLYEKSPMFHNYIISEAFYLYSIHVVKLKDPRNP